ncbi:MAG TPA: PKD domain-containing protein, partial [Ferruginibacter sp.]|nr:PKD domain-containing protein [Ferruginibacter sp.]
NGVNSWNWSFSDGRTASGQNVTMSFPVATPTVTVRLIVSNGSCNDTTSQTITLGNVITAAFTASTGDTICINTPVDFRDASSGTISSYLWDFGDLTQSTAQNPPTHVYATSNIYTVTLRVTDNHGCTATASKQMHVDASALIDFTGLKPQYCTGQTVSLKRVISRNITSYVWDNGDGKTFNNEVDIAFPYPNPGTYTITLSGTDKYCGPASISKTVPVYAVPKINLGPDTVLCGNDQVLIGVPAEPGYTYTWNTGDNTSQILTWAFFNTGYALTVDNHGCRARDSMHVKVLHFCLIRVPNAFTPNRDGLNDELKVLNADMAKSFEFSIYNRAGQRVFTTRNPLEGWDGRFKGNPADAGTYVWTLMYIDPWNGKMVKEKGTSILIR